MAEYYAVLSRAVSSLEVNTPETRRAVYDKARNALIGQLKAIVPPLPTSEISRQRLELEEAIRRAEREAASGPTPQRATIRPTVAAPPPPPPPRPEPEPVVEELTAPPHAPQAKDGSPQDVFRRAIREAETRADVPPPIERAPVREEAYGEPRGDFRVADRPPPRRAPPPEDPPYVPPEYRAPPRRQEPEPRLAPDFPWEKEPQERTAGPPRYAPTPELHGDDRTARIRDGRRKGTRDRDPRDHDHDHDVGAQFDDGSEIRQSRLPVILLLVLIVALVAGLAGLAWWQRGEIAKLFADTGSTKPAATQVAAAPAAAPAAPVPADDGKNNDRLLGGNGNAIATTPGVRVIGETGGPSDATGASDNATPAPGSASPAAAPAEVASAPAAPQPPAQAQPNSDTALVAQKAVLYEEPLDSSKAATGVTQINAAATWSYVNDPTNGPSVVANLDVPDRGLKVRLTIHKNTDKTLPASHLIEVVVNTTAAFPGKGISSIPRLVLKPSEDARGEPLVGATAKVSDGLFWIALSALPADTQNNMSLLKGRDWIDLPLVYDTGQRAILTFEKGTPGDRVLAQAMTAWAGG
jgi:hypothetical protein